MRSRSKFCRNTNHARPGISAGTLPLFPSRPEREAVIMLSALVERTSQSLCSTVEWVQPCDDELGDRDKRIGTPHTRSLTLVYVKVLHG